MEESNLEVIAGKSYMFPGHLAVGVYLNDTSHSALLIDSGVNEKEAKKMHDYIQKRGYQVTSIIVTHGHMSQLGGLRYFKEQNDNLKVYASDWTSQFIENLSLESWLIETNPVDIQKPGKERLKNIVTDILPYQNHTLMIEDTKVEIVTLPGHFLGMIGVITPDHVFYVADAIFGEHTLSKQKLLYYTDIQKAKASLKKIGASRSTAYVLTHGGKYESVTALIKQHLQFIDQTHVFVVDEMSKQPLSLEGITQKMMKKFGVKDDVEYFNLVRFITKSYLNQLQRESRLLVTVRDGVLYYYDGSLITML